MRNNIYASYKIVVLQQEFVLEGIQFTHNYPVLIQILSFGKNYYLPVILVQKQN